MARRKYLRDDIPIQPEDMGFVFADMQHQIPSSNKHGHRPPNDAYNDCDSERKQQLEDSLYKLLYSQYKWYGLEPYEAKFVERQLVNTGKVCAVIVDDEIKFGVYTSHPSIDTVDFYGRPTAAGCTGLDGSQFFADNPDGFVVGFDTMASYNRASRVKPIATTVPFAAREIYDAYEAWKVAAESRKAGMVYEAKDRNTLNKLKSIFTQISRNFPWVVVEGDMSGKTQSLFPNYNSTILEDFYSYYMNTFGANLDLWGMENNHNSKKERMLVDEVQLGMNLARYFGADRYRARNEFAEELSQKSGINITVENYLESVSRENQVEANKEGLNDKISGVDAKSGDV